MLTEDSLKYDEISTVINAISETGRELTTDRNLV